MEKVKLVGFSYLALSILKKSIVLRDVTTWRVPLGQAVFLLLSGGRRQALRVG
jgi:hypothetical protein